MHNFGILTNFRLKSDLKKKQKECGVKQASLIGECSTRWGSKFDMVQRIFENRQPIQLMLQAGKTTEQKVWHDL